MITELQRQQRADKIGSSDAAAILGLDPFKSASDVWLEKTGRVEPFAGNEATERGQLLEPALLTFAERQLGKRFARDVMCEHPSRLLVANLDGAVTEPHDFGFHAIEIIEAKSTVMGEEWGEEGTDQVPERVSVQVHHQFACVPTARVAWIPVLLPGYRSFQWRMYRVDRNDELVKIVEGQGIDFMEKYVKPQRQPSDFKPSLEVLNRVRREPEKVVPIADELVEKLIAVRTAKKRIEEACEATQAELLAALGDAEAGAYSKGMVTYFEQKRKGYTVADCTYRQLRTKAVKHV